MHFKHADTRILIAFTVAVLATSLGGHWLAGGWGLAVALSLATALVAGLSLAIHRSLLAREEQTRRQVQALATLHSTLPFRAPLPAMAGWACTPELAAIIVTEILLGDIELIVEAGSGVSTIVGGYAMEKRGKGRVLSLDHDADFGGQTTDLLARHGLSAYGEVVYAPLQDHRIGSETYPWYAIDAMKGERGIDLLVIDGPPRKTRSHARYPALPLLMPHLSPNAIIVLDDAARPDERAIVARWLKEYPEFKLEWVNSIRGTAILRRHAS